MMKFHNAFKSLALFLSALCVSVSLAADDKCAMPEKDFAVIGLLSASCNTNVGSIAEFQKQFYKFRKKMADFGPGKVPIADRYVVTAYAGVVDMRHFTYTALKATSDIDSYYWKGLKKGVQEIGSELPRRELLIERVRVTPKLHSELCIFDTFCVEKGREYLHAKQTLRKKDFEDLLNRPFWKATPEDMPSAALGTLFGEIIADKIGKLKKHEKLDIKKEFAAFLGQFKPVPDSIRKYIGHNEFVFSGAGDDDGDGDSCYFSAVPRLNTKLINEAAKKAGAAAFCEDIKDGNEGLAKAGYKVVKISRELPLRIVKK